MEALFDELDQQDMHLRRLSRRIDQLRGTLGRAEVNTGRELQSALEAICAIARLGGDPFPRWPDPVSICLTRVRTQRRLIEALAADVESLGGNPIREAIRNSSIRGGIGCRFK